jgi:6-phosphogluconolactonase (cycloisomerase 2 family)
MSSKIALMVVANMNSDNLVSFNVDLSTGMLTFTGQVVSTQPYHDEPTFVALRQDQTNKRAHI